MNKEEHWNEEAKKLDKLHKFWFGDEGICPICGEDISITGVTIDGRLIGSCKDVITVHQWETGEEDEDFCGLCNSNPCICKSIYAPNVGD